MIRFPCRCGHVFEMPDNTAGNDIQCPRCGLLNDVPLHGLLDALASDGTYKLDDTPAPADPNALNNMMHAFARGTVDADGDSIDRRTSAESLELVGEADTADSKKRRQRPRYDPETGERIDAIPLASGDMPPVADMAIPLAMPASIPYAPSDVGAAGMARHVLEKLVRPINLVVMIFIIGVYMATDVCIALGLVGIFLVAPGVLALAVAILAHYGNVVDEIGPREQDELPRPLRDLGFWEDMATPFLAMFGALTCCFAPTVIALRLPVPTALHIVLAVPVLLLGTYFFPAVFLTLQTSGSITNLNPVRVLATVRVIGKREYLQIAGVFLAAVIIHLWLILGLIDLSLGWSGVVAIGLPRFMTFIPVLLGLSCLGVLIMHYFCWTLGLLYRRHHANMPWVGRYHIPQAKPPVPRRKPRYVSAPPAE